MRLKTAVEQVWAQAYTVPTDRPEADGTASWTSTTIIVVQAQADGRRGIGYTYADASIADLIGGTLAKVATRQDAMDPPAAWQAMQVAVRNLGREGLAATAISAVDTALWDLKAALLDRPLASLLGQYRETVPIYGSGGFTSYDDRQLACQLAGWVETEGCRWVKMKIGSEPDRDPVRVAAAKAAIGSAGLFVDANGAYGRTQARHLANVFAAEQDVQWFEEPVSSDDLDSLRLLREQAPAAMEIAAGEYGYTLDYFRRMLAADAVDVLQADATRCGGVTGFLQAAALCQAYHTDLSAHCAPSLHRHLGCAVPRFRHLEWFHDHVRIEHMLFDGAPVPRSGAIAPDPGRPGLGLILKEKDAARFAVGGARAG
jgi:L-alanine-DL-glutamate epimerase-like enolase superfamily enzyme